MGSRVFDDAWQQQAPLVSLEARGLWATVCGWLVAHRSNLITAELLPTLLPFGRTYDVGALIGELVQARLWECVDGGYRPVRDATTTRLERRRKTTAARTARWRAARRGSVTAASHSVTVTPQTDSVTSSVTSEKSRPDAGVSSVTDSVTRARARGSSSFSSTENQLQLRGTRELEQVGSNTDASGRRRARPIPLPPELESAPTLDVIAWAARELGMDRRGVMYWHAEWVDALKAGRVKPSPSLDGYIASLRQSLRRQIGKPVPQAAAAPPAPFRPGVLVPQPGSKYRFQPLTPPADEGTGS